MASEEKEVRNAMEGLGGQITPEMVGVMDAMMQSLLQKGCLPKDVLGFTDEQVQDLYGQAYRLYNSGRYEEAIDLFRTLIIIDAQEPKYCFGMAACFHMLKNYAEATKAYTIAGILSGNDPVPYFHASDCYVQMKQFPSALVSLEMAVKRAGNKTEFQVLKDRALMTIESLKKVLPLGGSHD